MLQFFFYKNSAKPPAFFMTSKSEAFSKSSVPNETSSPCSSAALNGFVREKTGQWHYTKTSKQKLNALSHYTVIKLYQLRNVFVGGM